MFEWHNVRYNTNIYKTYTLSMLAFPIPPFLAASLAHCSILPIFLNPNLREWWSCVEPNFRLNQTFWCTLTWTDVLSHLGRQRLFAHGAEIYRMSYNNKSYNMNVTIQEAKPSLRNCWCDWQSLCVAVQSQDQWTTHNSRRN